MVDPQEKGHAYRQWVRFYRLSNESVQAQNENPRVSEGPTRRDLAVPLTLRAVKCKLP